MGAGVRSPRCMALLKSPAYVNYSHYVLLHLLTHSLIQIIRCILPASRGGKAPNRRTGRHVMSLRRCVCVNVMMMHHWTSFLDLLRKCSSLEYHDTCQHPLQKLLLDNKFPLQERDHARSVFQTQVMQIVDVREDGPCTDSKKMAQSWRQHPK